MFKAIEAPEKKGGGRFEIILPRARYMRDPLLPEGAPPLPMLLGLHGPNGYLRVVG